MNVTASKFKVLIIPVIISLVSLIVFIGLAFKQAGNQLTGFDQTVAEWIVAWRAPWLTGLMLAITQLGSASMIIIVLTVGTVAGLRRWRRLDVIFLNLGTTGAYLLNEALKQIFRRVRPPLPWLGTAGGYSFPSGHSLVSMVVYGILAYLLLRNLKNLAWRSIFAAVLLMLPILIGISRIYLGVHYPSDVLGGWAFAIGWAGIGVAVVEGYSSKLLR
jgi:membrane-associated phospholipid phosphatase